jgi:hypothetical protein
LKNRDSVDDKLLNSVEKLMQKLIAHSPFSVFTLSHIRSQQFILSDSAKILIPQVISKTFEKPNRIPFFYDYIVKNWLKFHADVFQSENAPEILGFFKDFADLLAEFTKQVIHKQNLYLLELVLIFYSKYFKSLKTSSWLQNIKSAVRKIRPKSAQAEFVLNFVVTLNPLINLLTYIENLRNLSFYELCEDETYFRQFAIAKTNHLSEQFEIFRVKLNRILSGD